MNYESFYEQTRVGPRQQLAQAAHQGTLHNVEDLLQNMSSVESISDARRLMMRMLQDTLRQRIHQTLWELVQDAQSLCENEPRAIVQTFQENLQAVEHWNARIIATEVMEIRGVRPDLDELITGAFVSTFMVLASVRGQNDDEVRLKVPSAEAFVHECYMLAAQEIYGSPFLYTEASTPAALVDYRSRALNAIDRCIEQAVLQRLSLHDVMRFPARSAPRPPRPAAQNRAPLTRENVEHIAPQDSVSQQGRPREPEPRQARAPPERSTEAHSRAPMEPQLRGSMEPQLRGPMEPQLRAPSQVSTNSQATFESLLRANNL